MPFLVDTRRVAPTKRLDAVQSAFSLARIPGEISVADLAGQGYASVESAVFGQAEMFQLHGTGVVRRSSERHVKKFKDQPYVAVLVPRSTIAFTEADHQTAVRAGQPLLMDRSSACEVGWAGHGDTISFQARDHEFGVPMDLIRQAARRLPASPLCGVVADHLVRLGRDADALSADPGAADLGVSTIAMIRALITSAVRDDRLARDARGEALVPLVLAYARQHLTDLDLTPLRLARAHHISVRHLYTVCGAADVRITEWIFEQRLAGAKRELEDPRFSARTIELTARRWGFIDPTHFGRRFKAAYGAPPREFKHHGRPAGSARPS